jgi:hypothetical protein
VGVLTGPKASLIGESAAPVLNWFMLLPVLGLILSFMTISAIRRDRYDEPPRPWDIYLLRSAGGPLALFTLIGFILVGYFGQPVFKGTIQDVRQLPPERILGVALGLYYLFRWMLLLAYRMLIVGR